MARDKIHNLGGATRRVGMFSASCWNFSKGNSDAYLDVRLSSKEREFVPPSVPSASRAAEKLDAITVKFSEPMSGIEAGLMVNDYPTLSVSAKGNAFTFDWTICRRGKSMSGRRRRIGDRASPPNAFAPKTTWTYELLDLVPPRLASHLPLGHGAAVQPGGGVVRRTGAGRGRARPDGQRRHGCGGHRNWCRAVPVYFEPILLGQVERRGRTTPSPAQPHGTGSTAKSGRCRSTRTMSPATW